MNRFESYFVVALGVVALAAIGWFSGLIPFILNGLYFLLQIAVFIALLPFGLAIIGVVSLFIPKK